MESIADENAGHINPARLLASAFLRRRKSKRRPAANGSPFAQCLRLLFEAAGGLAASRMDVTAPCFSRAGAGR